MEIVYHVAATLDGFIADDDGGVGFLSVVEDREEDHGLVQFYATIDALIMGRATYETALKLSGEWPYEDRPTWVMTSQGLETVHSSVQRTGASPSEVARSIETAGHGRAWLLGGGQLASSFLEEGLLTECIVAVVPVVLGSGIPMFRTLDAPRTLRFVDSKTFPTGLVMLRYAVDHADPAHT